jgi:hypothetical protein
MTWTSTLALAVTLVVSLSPQQQSPTTETWTGWFSDKTCARVTDDTPRPNGTACVKKCLSEGAAPVFISEQAKAVFEVRDRPTAKDDVGYHVELTGTVDRAANTISVQSVKRLSELTAICFIPKKGEKKKEAVVAPTRPRR